MKSVCSVIVAGTLSFLAIEGCTPSMGGDSDGGTPECCRKAAEIEAQIAPCCLGVVYKQDGLSGCCRDSQAGTPKSWRCCEKATALVAQIPECCRLSKAGEGKIAACCKRAISK